MNDGVQKKCRLSVVMLTFNRPQRCREAVEHTARALGDLPAEILVVNNGRQPPDLPEVIHGIPCRVISMPRNMGTEARNTGWQAAEGEYLIFLDDDAYIDKDLPNAIMSLFQSDPAIGAVSLPVHNGNNPESCLLPTVFHGCACGLRKSALSQIGGYPANFTYYGEEYHVAFRLCQTGYRTVHCETGGKVYHARETSGRDVNRIIQLLIRNNISLWCAFFPISTIFGAIYDTLQRYYYIAIKENARYGFRRGCLALPGAIIRGFSRRMPLSTECFNKIAMIDTLKQTCKQMKDTGATHVIVCGTGKLPSLWRKILHQNSIKVAGYLDHNNCWKNHQSGQVKVTVVDNKIPDIPPEYWLLVGTDSMTDNQLWLQQINRQKMPNRVACLPNPLK